MCENYLLVKWDINSKHADSILLYKARESNLNKYFEVALANLIKSDICNNSFLGNYSTIFYSS